MPNIDTETASQRKLRLQSTIDSSKYTKHRLLQAVFEMKFLPNLEIDLKIAEIQKRLKGRLSEYNESENHGIEIKLPEGTARNVEHEKIHKFLDSTGATIVAISTRSIAVELKANTFKSFEDFLLLIRTAFDAVNEVCQIDPNSVRRIGFRYINKFTQEQLPDPQKTGVQSVDGIFWKPFFNNRWLPDDMAHTRWLSEDRIVDPDGTNFTLRTAYNTAIEIFSIVDIDSYRTFGATGFYDNNLDSISRDLHRKLKLWFEMIVDDKVREGMR